MTAGVYPDFGAVGGAATIRDVIGALMMFALIAAVLMLVVCAAGWAVGAANGNYQLAGRARLGAWVALGTAALTGAGVAWMNFLIGVGAGF